MAKVSGGAGCRGKGSEGVRLVLQNTGTNIRLSRVQEIARVERRGGGKGATLDQIPEWVLLGSWELWGAEKMRRVKWGEVTQGNKRCKVKWDDEKQRVENRGAINCLKWEESFSVNNYREKEEPEVMRGESTRLVTVM